jgi:hypothetical protein
MSFQLDVDVRNGSVRQSTEQKTEGCDSRLLKHSVESELAEDNRHRKLGHEHDVFVSQPRPSASFVAGN